MAVSLFTELKTTIWLNAFNYQITFEATSDNAIGGEIAIDDVQVLNSDCPSGKILYLFCYLF